MKIDLPKFRNPGHNNTFLQANKLQELLKTNGDLKALSMAFNVLIHGFLSVAYKLNCGLRSF